MSSFRLLRGGRTLLLLGILAVAGALLWWRFGRGPEVAAVAATRGTAAEIVYATGAVEPVRWAKVASLIRDRIIEICYCEGKSVAKGDVLARLDDREARAQLTELQGARGVRQARAGARHRADRPRRGHHAGATSASPWTCARVQGLISVQMEKLALLHHHGAHGRGGAAARRRDRRDRGAGQVLFRVGVPKPLQVVAEVNEEDIPRVARRPERAAAHRCLPGPAARGHGAARSRRWATRSPRPTASASRCPTTRRCIAGMSVEANVVTREKAGALLVPADAVQGTRCSSSTAIACERRRSTIGIRGTRAIEVVSGPERGRAGRGAGAGGPARRQPRALGQRRPETRMNLVFDIA